MHAPQCSNLKGFAGTPDPTVRFKASGEAFDIHCLYKGIRIPCSSPTPSPSSALPLLSSSAQVLIFSVSSKHSTMSGSGGQGKWMASTIQEEDISELRAAGYLAKGIAHRLPALGQIVPTLKPNERVVFIPHFLCGLGFPLHPFVRGLMFYYRIDFHDLSPNSLGVHCCV